MRHASVKHPRGFSQCPPHGKHLGLRGSKLKEKELNQEFSVDDFVTRQLWAMFGNVFGCLDGGHY